MTNYRHLTLAEQATLGRALRRSMKIRAVVKLPPVPDPSLRVVGVGTVNRKDIT